MPAPPPSLTRPGSAPKLRGPAQSTPQSLGSTHRSITPPRCSITPPSGPLTRPELLGSATTLLGRRVGDNEGRVKQPEALTSHIAWDQTWSVEPALARWGFRPRLVEAASAGFATFGDHSPQWRARDFGPSSLGLRSGWKSGRPQKPAACACSPPPPPPAEARRRCSSGSLLPRLCLSRTPLLEAQEVERSEVPRVSTACSSRGHGGQPFCPLEYVHGIPEAPHFPGGSRSHSIRVVPGSSTVFL